MRLTNLQNRLRMAAKRRSRYLLFLGSFPRPATQRLIDGRRCNYPPALISYERFDRE
jgi:hypothetical protein